MVIEINNKYLYDINVTTSSLTCPIYCICKYDKNIYNTMIEYYNIKIDNIYIFDDSILFNCYNASIQIIEHDINICFCIKSKRVVKSKSLKMRDIKIKKLLY